MQSSAQREQTGPYGFLCGKTPVRLRFSETGKTIDEAVKDYLLGCISNSQERPGR